MSSRAALVSKNGRLPTPVAMNGGTVVFAILVGYDKGILSSSDLTFFVEFIFGLGQCTGK